MEGYCGFVFDIDDTAVEAGAQSVESRELRRAFAALPAGVIAIAATGRAEEHALPIIGPKGLSLKHRSVVANGGVIYDPATGRMIERNFLAEQQTAEVLRLCGQYTYKLYLAGDCLAEPKAPSQHMARPVSTIFIKAVPGHASNGILEKLMNIKDVYAYKAQAWGHRPNVFDIAVGHADAKKHLALGEVFDHYGIDGSKMVAIGDDRNDKDLFGAVGYKIAVANAHPEILAMADEVVSACQDGGLAEVVWRFSGGPHGVPGLARRAL